MASKAASKSKSAATKTTKRARTRKPASKRKKSAASAEVAIPRATSNLDDKEVLLSGGATAGTAYGRCGGRILSTRIEQQVCDILARTGVTHSHAPRHFEIRYEDERVAAYAPMIVLRVRGREGKTVVLEAADRIDEGTLGKIRAFRRQYGAEFYMCMIAPEEILDDIPLDAYDESATTEFAQNLISRLAD
ncbi:MAG: hypothetical protein KDB80_02425 [Planctomycetes bacterium]|nr:hypothetical protein [Planctomycetota bacterium]